MITVARMNTVQITRGLEQDPITSKKLCGVFPSDKLPQSIERYPCGFVVNTDPSSEPGTHWVAFNFPSESKGEFFNSYGKSPNYYNHSFENFLNKHSYEWDFNKRKLYRASGRMYVDSIAYFTLAIVHEDIAC